MTCMSDTDDSATERLSQKYKNSFKGCNSLTSSTLKVHPLQSSLRVHLSSVKFETIPSCSQGGLGHTKLPALTVQRLKNMRTLNYYIHVWSDSLEKKSANLKHSRLNNQQNNQPKGLFKNTTCAYPYYPTQKGT